MCEIKTDVSIKMVAAIKKRLTSVIIQLIQNIIIQAN